MELWAALVVELGGVALFASGEDLLGQIDQINLAMYHGARLLPCTPVTGLQVQTLRYG